LGCFRLTDLYLGDLERADGIDSSALKWLPNCLTYLVAHSYTGGSFSFSPFPNLKRLSFHGSVEWATQQLPSSLTCLSARVLPMQVSLPDSLIHVSVSEVTGLAEVNRLLALPHSEDLRIESISGVPQAAQISLPGLKQFYLGRLKDNSVTLYTGKIQEYYLDVAVSCRVSSSPQAVRSLKYE
jgi:hypothetical protein